MSRQPTWDMALALQADMFHAVKAVGGLDVQLVYFRGTGECRASKWVSDPDALAALMTQVHCAGGYTQIGKVLSHARARGRQAARERARLRRRLHGGGDRRSVRPRRRARAAGRAGVPVPGGRTTPAPSRPSARSRASPRAPTAASMRDRRRSCASCWRPSPSMPRAGARRCRRSTGRGARAPAAAAEIGRPGASHAIPAARLGRAAAVPDRDPRLHHGQPAGAGAAAARRRRRRRAGGCRLPRRSAALVGYAISLATLGSWLLWGHGGVPGLSGPCPAIARARPRA